MPMPCSFRVTQRERAILRRAARIADCTVSTLVSVSALDYARGIIAAEKQARITPALTPAAEQAHQEITKTEFGG